MCSLVEERKCLTRNILGLKLTAVLWWYQTIWKQLLCVTTYKAVVLFLMSSASMKTSQRKSEGIREEAEYPSISERFWKAQWNTKCFKMMVKNRILGLAHYWLGFCQGQERLDIHFHRVVKMNHRSSRIYELFCPH